MLVISPSPEAWGQASQPASSPAGAIPTPKPGPAPRINGPSMYGARPGSPFLFTIPATGDRPMEFDADGLPEGLSLDRRTGILTGSLRQKGEPVVRLRATNHCAKAICPPPALRACSVSVVPTPLGFPERRW